MNKLSIWVSGLWTGAAISSFINGSIFFGIGGIGIAILLLLDGLRD